MKKLLLTTLSLVAAMTFVHGQGTVLFQNITPVNAPVFDERGTSAPRTQAGLQGAGFQAQLWAAAPGGQLQAVGSSVSFLTGTSGAGFFIGGTRAIPGVAGGGAADIQVRAWRVADGATWQDAFNAGRGFGMSGVVRIQATGGGGDPPGPPVQLTGLQSFALVPEPSTIALGIIGGLGTLLLIRRRK